MRAVRIATRGSQLAVAQASWVAQRIEEALGVSAELVRIKTSGDRLRDVSLAKLGGKGLFVKEIEEALLDGRADVAVHSAKDLPAELTERLVLAAFPRRVDPRDALLTRRRGIGLQALPKGAHVGTGSLRRAAQLRAWRPELEVVPLRGNVTTRLRKLENGEFDAVVVACAGLERLGLAARIDERLDDERMLPAVGQGALALQARAGESLAGDLAALDHPDTAQAVACERAFLSRLGGDCTTPLAALAERSEGTLQLRALLADPAGERIVRARTTHVQAETAGLEAAERILADGGTEILESLRHGPEA